MRIGIINIGDELLSGKILNSNQYELAKMLQPLGHSVVFGLVLGDNKQDLKSAFDWVLHRNRDEQEQDKIEILVLTGGLGPTRDDLTREAVAEYFGVQVQEDFQALEWLAHFLKKSIPEIPPGQRVQVGVPVGMKALRNPVGTACGLGFSLEGIPVFAFPGVPAELKSMASLHLLPGLTQAGVLLERSLWTFGWSEGSQKVAFAHFKLAEYLRFSSLPNERGVLISLSSLAPLEERESRQKEIDTTWEKLVQSIPSEAIVDRGGLSITEAVQTLLLARKAKVSVAESCTGGGLGVLLTELPGSSRVFEKGFLTYSNSAKTELLGVKPEALKIDGAVSESTVLAMVKGCLERAGSDYACAITGIAGPDGGSEEKPVGTVWIAVASRQKAVSRRFQFRGNRAEVRSRSNFNALNMLRLLLTEQLD